MPPLDSPTLRRLGALWRSLSLPESPPPPALLCLGVFGSGVTWAANTALEALREAGAPGLQLRYGDDELAPGTLRPGRSLVILSHHASEQMLARARRAGIPVLVTLRAPEAAVLSLMRRFRLPFGTALEMVRGSAETCCRAQGALPLLALRYESGFARDIAGATAIARHLRLRLQRDSLELLAGAPARPRDHWPPPRAQLGTAQLVELRRVTAAFRQRFHYA